MLIDNGGLESAMKHLVGVRNFFILSASNKTFRCTDANSISLCDLLCHVGTAEPTCGVSAAAVLRVFAGLPDSLQHPAQDVDAIVACQRAA